MEVSAQISLYALGREDLGAPIDLALGVLLKEGLDVRPGSMSTLVRGEIEVVFPALRKAFSRVAEHDDVVMVVTVSNACPDGGEGSVR
jgi:uncharacterized protein YqgV (UPF0045/DUF77 family)